ncbi:MAG: phosphatidylglycerophosphatase A [Candidatus Omnitrophota bacterium]
MTYPRTFAGACKLVATCFGVGYLPVMPGTWASLAALPVYVVLRDYPAAYAAVTGLAIVSGFLVAGQAEKAFARRDPGEIVIDEFSAQLAVFLYVRFTVPALVAGFLVFRLLDVLKPWPIRKLQDLPGAPGIMLDDVAAAVVSGIVVRLVNCL